MVTTSYCYHQYFIAHLKMANSNQRTLRNRRLPTYLLPDNEDGQQLGYPRTSFSKEYVSPAQELNNIAKLLSKFINSSNKNLKQASKNEGPNKHKLHIDNSQVADKPIKKAEPFPDPAKKKTLNKDQLKIQGQKPSKNIYSFKEQNIKKQIAKSQELVKNQEPNNKSVDKTSNPKKNVYSLNTNPNYLSLINKLNEQKFSSQNLPHLNTTELNHIILQQQQAISSRLNLPKSPLLGMEQIEHRHQANASNRDKLFGRSSFHVAIAYHIHLKNLQDKNVDLKCHEEVDPTYRAKKLKGNYQS